MQSTLLHISRKHWAQSPAPFISRVAEKLNVKFLFWPVLLLLTLLTNLHHSNLLVCFDQSCPFVAHMLENNSYALVTLLVTSVPDTGRPRLPDSTAARPFGNSRHRTLTSERYAQSLRV